jgi:nucleotide-binding universal stress UspA family protein
MHILLAYDGSQHAMAAVDLLRELPVTPGAGSSVTVLAVLPTQYFEAHEMLQEMLDQVKAGLQTLGLHTTTLLKTGNPAATINNLVTELEEKGERVDLIMMGAKGLRATLGILLGGVAQQVVEYSSCPVLVVRAAADQRLAPQRQGLKRILVVTDGSPQGQRAVEYLAPVCAELRSASRRRCWWLPAEAEVFVMHVLPPAIPVGVSSRAWMVGPEVLYPAPMPPIDTQQLEAEEEKVGERILAEATATLEAAGIQAQPVTARGDAATEILGYAKKNQIDLVVCGSRGLSEVTGWLLGSVSRKLVHYADCSVLVVR